MEFLPFKDSTDTVVIEPKYDYLAEFSEGLAWKSKKDKIKEITSYINDFYGKRDKETEEFMTKFYKKLIKNNDIKLSFAETQKEMWAKYDPYFWATFVLIE